VSVGSDLGVAKASLAYQKAEVAGSDRKYTILNVSAPLGGLTLAGSYAKYDAATGDYDMMQIGLIKDEVI